MLACTLLVLLLHNSQKHSSGREEGDGRISLLAVVVNHCCNFPHWLHQWKVGEGLFFPEPFYNSLASTLSHGPLKSFLLKKAKLRMQIS